MFLNNESINFTINMNDLEQHINDLVKKGMGFMLVPGRENESYNYLLYNNLIAMPMYSMEGMNENTGHTYEIKFYQIVPYCLQVKSNKMVIN